MRGEKPPAAVVNVIAVGSPPHARGKVSSTDKDSPRTRITPACAGKSGGQRHCPGELEDHPRMRGEKPGRLVTGKPL